MMKKLFRSRHDAKLFGLCGGLAERFEIDATLVRLMWIVAAFITGGSAFFLYIIASMLVPKEPIGHMSYFPPSSF
jgi:phage shock protein PspC (stress-responsive transcriptional regulator)